VAGFECLPLHFGPYSISLTSSCPYIHAPSCPPAPSPPLPHVTHAKKNVDGIVIGSTPIRRPLLDLYIGVPRLTIRTCRHISVLVCLLRPRYRLLGVPRDGQESISTIRRHILDILPSTTDRTNASLYLRIPVYTVFTFIVERGKWNYEHHYPHTVLPERIRNTV
jgi:hypothetical protein